MDRGCYGRKQFFPEATLRICSSLNLERALKRTLEYVSGCCLPISLSIALYDPDLNIMRTLVHIAPEGWPTPPEKITVPEEAMERILSDWRSEAKFGVVNDFRELEPEIKGFIKMRWPEDISLPAHGPGARATSIENLSCGPGRHRYRRRMLD